MILKENKLISIILPVYNGEAFLGLAIESILEQSYSNFELIIVDDFSKDSSLDIANEFAKTDNRIFVYANKENKKLPATLNVGHFKAKGDYITWTSDDNILKTNFLESLVETSIFEKADIVYSNYDVIFEDGKLKRKHIVGSVEHLFFGNVIGASFLYKKKVFEVLEGYDENLYLLEDYDFWLRASLKFKFFYLNKNLYKYRLHNSSLTAQIQNNITSSNKHNEALMKMFQKISEQFHWKESTLEFLVTNYLKQNMDIFNVLKNRKSILEDLLKPNSKNLDYSFVVDGFEMQLRKQLMDNNCNFKSLIWVLKNERWLLFRSSFSRKTTLDYILRSLLR